MKKKQRVKINRLVHNMEQLFRLIFCTQCLGNQLSTYYIVIHLFPLQTFFSSFPSLNTQCLQTERCLQCFFRLSWKSNLTQSLSVLHPGSGVLLRPVFTKQPGSVVFPIQPGENRREVVFSCEAQGHPPPFYR